MVLESSTGCNVVLESSTGCNVVLEFSTEFNVVLESSRGCNIVRKTYSKLQQHMQRNILKQYRRNRIRHLT